VFLHIKIIAKKSDHIKLTQAQETIAERCIWQRHRSNAPTKYLLWQ